MTRERLVFDVCAAPFGKAYFFSCRFAEIPAVIKFWQLALLIVTFLILIALAWRFFGLWLGSAVLIAATVLIFYILRNAVSLGLRNLDATLIKSPVFGPIYERFFRKETYYRQDTQLMYCDTVDAVVKARVEEVTGAKGIKLLRFNEYSPLLAELYKPTTVSLPKPA